VGSPTQRRLKPVDIDDYLRQAFGAATRVTEAVPAGGGTFAAVWRVALADGRDVILKVGPEPSIPLLTYEAGLIDSEAWYFRRVAQAAPRVPVPAVLHAEPEWLITGFLPGVALTEKDDPRVREQLGAALARVHEITGDRFGYSGRRPHATTWPAAFAAMMEALLSDALMWKVSLPVDAGLIRRVVADSAAALAQVTRPALVHFDLWDGNVLHAGGSLTGLLDGERFLFGDPLVDFVSPLLFRNAEDEPDHPFLTGYGKTAFTAPERRRLGLYRLYLYLLMHVEVPSRGITDERRISYVERCLAEQAGALASE
jgi:aminoglycoside phosphotransferase (APT) family kinase protein